MLMIYFLTFRVSPTSLQDCIQLNQYKLKSEIGKVSAFSAICQDAVMSGSKKKKKNQHMLQY